MKYQIMQSPHWHIKVLISAYYYVFNEVSKGVFPHHVFKSLQYKEEADIVPIFSKPNQTALFAISGAAKSKKNI